MKLRILSAALLASMAFASGAFAGNGMMSDPMVGGAAMYADKDIVDNAVNSKDHTTLVAAVKAAGLVDTLKSPGPFTVFAPTNAAFGMLPAGTVDNLLKPENKGTLTSVLTYHVVPGRLDISSLNAQIKAGGGKAMLKTVQGEDLTVMGRGKHLTVTDSKGNMAHITIADRVPEQWRDPGRRQGADAVIASLRLRERKGAATRCPSSFREREVS
jgi:uncharacterized surface protein with fasciclin (FAS1) repeats